MLTVALASETDWDGWRAATRALVLADVDPAAVRWRVGGRGDALPGAPDAASSFGLPRSLLALAQLVVQAREADRFDLLHRLVWRARHGGKSGAEAEADAARARHLALDVRREAHRMRALLRYLPAGEHDDRLLGWFVPRHFVLEADAQLIAARAPGRALSILTPDGSAHWDGAALTFGPAPLAVPADDDGLRRLWRREHARLLSQARPGTAIPPAEPLDEDPRPPERPALAPVVLAAEAWALRDAARDAAGCTNCPLYAPATQTVFGEGPDAARLLLIGEQPGDQEDVIGRPFVGPAGQMLDRALEDAGIDRRTAYVTNAVKHFKFEPRGKRRIHQSPDRAEVVACSVWLDTERAALKPGLLVLMGATAARAVLNRAVTIGRERGRVFRLPDGQAAFITVHPSYLLRLPDADSRAREYAAFVRDLRIAAEAAGD